ncbi:prepilin peptidase [Knoellia sp. p5-6-4]|uniref:prepilin peptidase n=1 Tax=unclassified Knoellia TaxID=2618719 RepID=UPI0023D9898D|nr:prepilin peptidase [Knoellia sp. p5-6-4]MDF2145856.1 prepilin peptidase [Knoellia sp. p5-6-4]
MLAPVSGAGTAGWVIGVLVLAGALLGVATAQALRSAGYRIESDEPATAQPRAPWWPVPALAVLWGFLAWGIGDLAAWAALPAYLFFAWLAVALVWIDLDVHRLPDGLVLPAYPALLVLLGCASLGAGDWVRMRNALIAMAGIYALYFVMAMVSPSSLGFGDVKLSGLIGLVLGWLGLGTALLGLLAGFVAGGIIALVMLVAQRAGLRSHIAFGPAMVVGALLALAFEYRLVPV